MLEQKRLGDNGTSAATAKESGDRGDEMDEKDGQVAHLAIVPISTSVTRLGTRWDLCDKSGIRHGQVTGHRFSSLAELRPLVSSATTLGRAPRAFKHSQGGRPCGLRARRSSARRGRRGSRAPYRGT